MATPNIKHQTKGDHAQHHGTGRYWGVWAALMAFTIITVVTGKMNFGGANIWIAMLIATTKATLVVLFFMHLSEAGGVIRLVFVVSILFVAVLMLGVFGDLFTRNPITLPNGGPVPAGTVLPGAKTAAPAPHGTQPAAPAPAH